MGTDVGTIPYDACILINHTCILWHVFFWCVSQDGRLVAAKQLKTSPESHDLESHGNDAREGKEGEFRPLKFVPMLNLPIPSIWSNYSDLTRPHPIWRFGKGTPLISGISRLVKYYNLARSMRRTVYLPI